MNSLKVPDSGLRLSASGGDGLPVPPQAFFLTLDDNAIEDMIRSVQAGEEMRLKLGNEPTLKYGSNTRIITQPSDSLPYDLYLTRPYESTKSAERLPSTGSLFKKPKSPSSGGKPRAVREVEGRNGSDKSKGSSSSGLESDYETLRDGLAAEEAARGRTRIVDQPLTTKRGGTKLKGRAFSPNPSSLPASPALRGVSPAPTASQQAIERSKHYRVPLVHELAVKDQTLEYLQDKWEGNEADLRAALEKVADPTADKKLWTMRRTYYRELDVYSYSYDTQEEREQAIKNATRQYDKQRLSSREPEWERLNAPEDRGKGICLSNLQAKIAKEPPPPAPKIKVQKADDGSSSKEEGNTTDSSKAKKGGESMSRSSSNPLPGKGKKLSAADAQTKRLLGNGSKAKVSTTTTASNPTVTPKVSPSKGKAGKAGDGRILSQEIIFDSDVSEDEAAPPKPKAAPVKPKAKEVEAPKPRPVAREPVKSAPAKRQREDDDSSSSSGTPLSKRLKGRQAVLPLKPKSSQTFQRTVSAAPPPRPKNTSPTKSSPLASSPPTNVSDMDDDDTPPPPPPLKKRRADMDSRDQVTKRKRVFTDDIMSLTNKFKDRYDRYVRLHQQIEASPNPTQSRIDDLLRMRSQLESMKKRIYGAC